MQESKPTLVVLDLSMQGMNGFEVSRRLHQDAKTISLPVVVHTSLPAELEITLFRLIQESLTNIHRHSGSKTALVRVNRNGSSLDLEVTDQGRGFNLSGTGGGARPRYGVGIPGMKERVRRLGGTIDISSSPGGTTVKARLPISLHSN